MKRILMSAYIKGTVEALEVYRRAVNADLGYNVKHEDGTYDHAELDIYGYILGMSERTGESDAVPGNTMQYCLHFEESEKAKIDQAYEVLKEGAQILHPLGECDYTSYMTDMIDRFGIRWCLFLAE